MQTVEFWMTSNRLSLNVKKTKMMLIGRRQRLRGLPDSVSLNRERMDMVSYFKYLGMIVDSHLCLDKNVVYVVDKSTSKLGVLYKT